MMERLHGRNLGLPLYVIFVLVVVIQSSFAQKGFISINCCAESNSTDALIFWITDFDWFPGISNCQKISRPVENSTDYSARTFNIDSGKICYNLTTIKHRDYLIRGNFSYEDTLSPPSIPSFEVLIGVTPISLVKSSDNQVVEAVFKAKKEYIDFCLLKKEGDPYILQLELRSLNQSRYLEGDSLTVLKLISRVDLGNRGGLTRYPDDRSDRIWTSDETTYDRLSNAYQSNTSTNIPLKVLQTAVTSPDKLVFLHDLDAGKQNYKLFLYFLELNSTVQIGQRVFDIYVNEKRIPAFDIKANGSNYNEVVLNVAATGALNLTLAKVPNRYDFGPICNAYEIFQVQSWIQETNQGDVDIMASIRNELEENNNGSKVLTSWSGDPCLPAAAAWEGVRCENVNDGSMVVTKLDLASRSLKGLIPSAIVELKYLKELNLSYNNFTGNFPMFQDSSLLSSLDVRSNNLVGMIPESTFYLTQLTKLYFGCNPLLDNYSPASFNDSRLMTDHGNCMVRKSSKSDKIFIGTVAAGSSLLVILATLFICFYRQRLARARRSAMGYPLAKRVLKDFHENAVFSIASADEFKLKPILVQNFTLEHVEAATQKYKTLIGEGGFGSVYRGTLRDGQEVAVKVRSATSTQGTREFDNELNLLSAIRHENLVPLLGFCCENDQQILVYPFMSNGSLQDRLYGEASKRKVLDWPTRLSIALGAARGLTHLHTFCGRCVIHRDVKSSNILLDHSMCAKVADFGFSKYAPQEGDSGASLEVRGTAGYLDPEYYSTQHLSAKSDVFSFGVVLLEIISGREPLNIHRPRNEWSLVEWAKPYIREQKIDEIVDPSIKGMYHAEPMWRVVEVALSCIEPFSAYRPSMPDIVRELEDALIIENNASEYMKSIDSFGGSNRYSIVLERKPSLPPASSAQIEPTPLTPQTLTPPAPR